MEYAKCPSNGGYLVRLSKDEEVFASLGDFAERSGVRTAVLTGIGALKDAELGFYHLDRRDYERRHFAGEAELLGLTGNLSLLEEKPFFHIHVVLGAEDFSAYGGHLFGAKVAVTLEIHLLPMDLRLSRRYDAEVGLNLLSLCPSRRAV